MNNQHISADPAVSTYLTAREKDAMRLVLAEHMRQRPLSPVKSPWTAQVFLRRTVAGLFAVVLLCSGTAYAARGSMPGDALYPVRLGLNERIQVAFAGSVEEKSKIEAQLAGLRLQEAQELASRGGLDDDTAAKLQENFIEHATDALVFAQKVDAQNSTFDTSFFTGIEASTSVSSSTEGTEVAQVYASHFSALKSSLVAQATLFKKLRDQKGETVEDVQPVVAEKSEPKNSGKKPIVQTTKKNTYSAEIPDLRSEHSLQAPSLSPVSTTTLETTATTTATAHATSSSETPIDEVLPGLPLP